MGLIAEIMNTVDTSCKTFIQSNVVAVADGIKDPAFAILGVYVLFWGFSHMMNLVQEPITDTLKRLLKIIFVFGIAFNLGAYNSYVVDTITKGPEELAALFAGGSSDIASSLDIIFSETWDIGSKFWSSAGIFDGNFGFYLVAVIIYGIACGLAAFSAFLIVLSKVAVSVLVALGPLFIISTMFDATKRFFENWVGMLCNYGLIVVLLIGVNSFILDIFTAFMQQAVADNTLEISSAAPVATMSIICFFVLGQVLTIASGLGGGVALATMGAVRWVEGQLGTASAMTARTSARGAKTATSATAAYVGEKLRPRSVAPTYARRPS